MDMLSSIADDVWSIDATVKPAPGCTLPARATLIRLARGDLVLHSPLPIDDALAVEIEKLGPVRTIIAPSRLHTSFLADARDRFKEARVLEAASLPARGEVADGLEVKLVEGAPKFDEHVFFHRLSRSLVVTDLLFNVHAGASTLMSLAMRINGAYGRLAQSRVWGFATKDREARRASEAAIGSWDFRRIILAHGDVVEEDARGAYQRALACSSLSKSA